MFLKPSPEKFSPRFPLPETLVYAPIETTARAIRNACGNPPTLPRVADAIPASGNELTVILGPGIGWPAANLACEPFLAAGLKRLILFGTCGGLTSKAQQVEIGDLIFPLDFLESSETPPLTVSESSGRKHCIERLSSETRRIHTGAVWTTNSPFEETPETVEAFRRQGALGVDMESIALARLAQRYQAEFICCLAVSDTLGETWTPGFKSSSLRTAVLDTAQAIKEICESKALGRPDKKD